MQVAIKQIDKIRLAVIEHRGDPDLIPESINKLITWAKEQTINLQPTPGNSFAIAYDDPKTTPPEQFRFDLGIKIPGNLTLKGAGC